MTEYHDPDIQETSIGAIEDPEPWEPWETWLCAGSIALGVACLIVLGILVNHFFL